MDCAVLSDTSRLSVARHRDDDGRRPRSGQKTRQPRSRYGRCPRMRRPARSLAPHFFFVGMPAFLCTAARQRLVPCVSFSLFFFPKRNGSRGCRPKEGQENSRKGPFTATACIAKKNGAARAECRGTPSLMARDRAHDTGVGAGCQMQTCLMRSCHTLCRHLWRRPTFFFFRADGETQTGRRPVGQTVHGQRAESLPFLFILYK